MDKHWKQLIWPLYGTGKLQKKKAWFNMRTATFLLMSEQQVIVLFFLLFFFQAATVSLQGFLNSMVYAWRRPNFTDAILGENIPLLAQDRLAFFDESLKSSPWLLTLNTLRDSVVLQQQLTGLRKTDCMSAINTTWFLHTLWLHCKLAWNTKCYADWAWEVVVKKI